ncbi:fimbrial protein [Vibrio sp. SBT000027]|jgi:type 1 fimbria pilin|uniref:fimbrial protein n=1 Tax=Vibrio sp. SBT000027 TaxID=1803384 RepID=UPI000EF45AEC|nr:fimbrial protein [Vibrio sp. SBT000027]RLQ17076.1 hypothetical protein AYK60_18365 [Vibrio sp. SBT000027]
MYIFLNRSLLVLIYFCSGSFSVAYSGNPSYYFVDMPDHTTSSLLKFKYSNYWDKSVSNYRFDSLTINDDSKLDSNYQTVDGVSIWYLKGKKDKALFIANDKSRISVFPTEYKGIGYVVEVKSLDGSWNSIGESGESKLSSHTLSKGFTPYLRLGAFWRVGFVFLEPLKSGKYKLGSRKVGEFRLSKMADSFNRDSLGFYVPLYYSGFGFTVTTNTCDFYFENRESTINLPKLNGQEFTGRDENYGGTVFKLKLNCPSSIRVSSSISDANMSSNIGNVLTREHAESLFRVGLQLYVEDYKLPIYLNETKLGWVSNGSKSDVDEFNIKFTARYVGETDVKESNVVAFDALINLYYY